jgi:hypothetical protein
MYGSPHVRHQRSIKPARWLWREDPRITRQHIGPSGQRTRGMAANRDSILPAQVRAAEQLHPVRTQRQSRSNSGDWNLRFYGTDPTGISRPHRNFEQLHPVRTQRHLEAISGELKSAILPLTPARCASDHRLGGARLEPHQSTGELGIKN